MKHITDSEMKWCGVDFDDCICSNSGYPHYEPQNPKMDVIRGLRALRKAGYKIHVHTSRPSAHYYNIESWMKEHKVPFDAIDTGKPLYRLYIDDKAYHFTSWNKSEVENMLSLLKGGDK